jgi:uncharacterized membrane protein YhaH (DUF805 family)
MSLPKDQAWFHAKRYGYGWGLPARWQGWLALLVFFAALAAGAGLARSHRIAFVVYVAAWGVALVALCAWKGESPRWRWGKEDGD